MVKQNPPKMYSFLYYRIDFFFNLINYAKERNRMEKFSVYETPAQLLLRDHYERGQQRPLSKCV